MSSLRATPASINGWNAEYLEAQYQAFRADPASIAPDLVPFFQGFDLALGAGSRPVAAGDGAARSFPQAAATGLVDALRFHAGVTALVQAYRTHGHFIAKLDPFGRGRENPRPVELNPSVHGLDDGDLGRAVGDVAVVASSPALPKGSLRELVAGLETIYSSSIGAQVQHIADAQVRQWLTQQIESLAQHRPSAADEKLAIFDCLVRSEQFERFLQKRYQGDKRFSLEGGETAIAIIERLLLAASETDSDEVVIGMAHRGRLNVLNNVMGKTYEQIFTEFQDAAVGSSPDGGGDVKYHRGYSGQRTLSNGKPMHLALASNPSHLESAGPVVSGRTRAKQRLRNDKARTRVIPLLLHGDAAVIGQGVVAELLNMSQLQGYTVGGTVHLVINNLIGFTTLPRDSRSNAYCTDLALSIDAPIFHVSGEDPEACVAVAKLAMLYRQTFKRDVFIDMWCYRKYGHNEQDEASFTQPKMAELIKGMPGVASTYGQQLVAQGVMTQAGLDEHRAKLDVALEAAQQKALNNPHDPNIDPGGKRWSGMNGVYSHAPVNTGVKREILESVCAAMGRAPEGFAANPKLAKLLAERAALPTSGQVCHADAEMLAIGSLLLEGTAVRLSGQDCRRGTFSQRHAVLFDYQKGEAGGEGSTYIPLNNLRPIAPMPDDAGKPDADGRLTQSQFCVYDSPLSEFAVMGFDYGYSLADPNMLVMWEGQFGDFCNGAQTIIDQYIAAGEIKWNRWSGLVLLLPHGYEGAGPEHSSARMERFLQLCGNDNMQVVYPSTAAQMFHLLRRQVSPQRKFRKPLVVMTPKSMLRVNTSTFDELTKGTFQDVLDDPAFVEGGVRGASGADKVSRVLLCSGKVYHELAARRAARQQWEIAIVRLEQIYPLNAAALKSVLRRYPHADEVCWVQEEPRNAGAFTFVNDLLTVLPDPTQSNPAITILPRLRYIGRAQCATPAVGSKKKHKDEQEAILYAAVGADPAKGDGKAGSNGASHGAGSNGSVAASGAVAVKVSEHAKPVKSKK